MPPSARLAAAFALLGVAPAALGGDALDDYVKAHLARRKVPGLALAVFWSGGVATTRVFGNANVELSSPVKPSSAFDLSTLARPFGAAAVMLLSGDGALGLDDLVGKHLADAPSAWSARTVRQLLAATAGAGDAAAEAAAEALVWRLVEKASGRRPAEFLRDRVFGPLGMKSTGFFDAADVVPERAAAYTLRVGVLKNARRPAAPDGAGAESLFSTLDDLARWENALAKGRLLPAERLAEMWRPAAAAAAADAGVAAGAGLGWRTGEHRGHRVVEAGGASGTHHLRFPDLGLSIVVLTNLDVRSGSQPDAFARAVAGLVDSRLVPPHLIAAPEKDPDPTRTERIRGVLADLADGREPADATPQAKAALAARPSWTKDELAARLKGLASLTLLACDDVKAPGPLGARTVCHYRAVEPQGTRYYSFWLAADGKLADLASYAE